MITLVIFSDDWGRHPSSLQHLIRHLCQERNDLRICWINTIGTRVPGFNRITLIRAWEKAHHWLIPRKSSVSEIPTAPCKEFKVFHPVMWPWFRKKWDRRINAWILTRYLRKLMAHEASVSQKIVGITTLPVTADLVASIPEIHHWIYYCVDDWSEWPGMDARPLREMEHQLIRQVDCVLCAGNALQARVAQLGPKKEPILLTHGVDLERWSVADPSREVSDHSEVLSCSDTEFSYMLNLSRCEVPRFTFWGLIDQRLDLHFLRCLGEKLETSGLPGTITLIGPSALHSAEMSVMQGLPRVEVLGEAPYESLPDIAACSSVLIMPYADLPVTRQMQPLKMLEYLATGRAVVARNLPAIIPWNDTLDVVSTAEEFAQRCVERAVSGVPSMQYLARERLKEETWTRKAQIFSEYL